MRLKTILLVLASTCILLSAAERKTVISIRGDEFHINGQPTYAGRTWNGHKIQGCC